MRLKMLPCLLLLVLGVTLTGCARARCAWEDTKRSAVGAMPKTCCPDPCGNVYSEPIYGGGCGGDNGVGSGGTGAFQTP